MRRAGVKSGRFVRVRHERKLDHLVEELREAGEGRTLVFVRTKRGADRLVKRLGALEAYTDHQPVFSEDDLDLVRLLADQAAVILESRALIDEAARVQAHEEAARLNKTSSRRPPTI